MEKYEIADSSALSENSGDNSPIEKTSGDDVETNAFSPSQTARLLKKMDLNLLPFLALLYLLSFLDRSNIGNAKIAGLEKDLKMTGAEDYNTAVAIFFPLYILSEVPSNILMKRLRPSSWLPSIMVACVTTWYKRNECGTRIAVFFSTATLAGAFGGLLARGIMEMEGIGGKHGWAWIFILEGLVTFIVAIAAYFAMHDYPDTAKFLTQPERQEVLRRLEEDRSALSDRYDIKFVKDALKDWKVWVNMLATAGIYTALYSVSFFMPTIVANLGYSRESAQLMTVPPYFAACFVTICCGIMADRHGQRGVYMMCSCTVAIIGFVILATVKNHHGVKYFACFLITTGVYPNIPQQSAWTGNNLGGTTKRAVGMAMQTSMGNLGGLISGYIFRKRDAPGYVTAHIVLSCMMGMTLLLSAYMRWWLRKENARRDREYKSPSEYTPEEMELECDKGDDATFFRYTF
ncbi:putative transporter [Cladobotryum mycophilum]|uniref:Transporter n=1 Tax=Cladobotryum mycophilum TaxID=491253 RepID=A0ABR0SAR8_9HYPO